MIIGELLAFFLSTLAIVSFLLTGMVVARYLLAKEKLGFSLAAWLGLGIGTLTIFQLVLSQMGLVLSRSTVFWVLGLVISPFFLDKKFFEGAINPKLWWRALGQRKAMSLVLLLVLVRIILETFSHTIWGSDAYTFWLAKASAFYKDGLVNKVNIYAYWPYDHPLLWPLTATWVYHFLGRIDEYFLQIVPLTVWLALLLAFYQGLKKQGNWRFVWLGVLLVTPFVWQNVSLADYVGNADLLVGFYFLLAVICLLEKKLLVTALFLFFASLTKNDALSAAVGFLLTLPFLSKHFQVKEVRKSGLVLISLLVFHWLWKQQFGLSSRYWLSLREGIIWQRPFTQYMWYTANAFREEFRQVRHWGLGWWLIFFSILTGLKTVFRDRLMLVGWWLLLCQMFGYFLVYYLTPEDQASQIATSIFRLVLQLYPAALFLAAKISYNKR